MMTSEYVRLPSLKCLQIIILINNLGSAVLFCTKGPEASKPVRLNCLTLFGTLRVPIVILMSARITLGY